MEGYMPVTKCNDRAVDRTGFYSEELRNIIS